MPPKAKITKQDIICTALELVRAKGEDAINARAIASALNCSTQPIFSNFTSMEELQDAVVSSAYGVYLDYIKKEVESGKYPQYKAFGMAYIRFAEEEKELFKLLFMCDRSGKEITPSTDFTQSVEIIMKANGLTKEKAELIHLEMWTCVHGIATMHVTSYISFDSELISRILTDVYQGLRTRHSQEAENERN